MRFLRLSVSVFLLAFCSAYALGTGNYISYSYWLWDPQSVWLEDQRNCEFLTPNNGAHAVSMTKYGSQDSVWVNIVTSIEA